jgi:hypothetical protein
MSRQPLGSPTGRLWQRGSITTEYLLTSAILAIALGLGFADDGPLSMMFQGLATAWQKFVYAMSTAF